jgi:hypothetical protein
MRFFKALALSAFVATVSAQEQTASTDLVKVDFVGASGKMKLFPAGSDGSKKAGYVVVSQEKLQEMNGDTKQSGAGRSLNVAGKNSWTVLQKEGDSYRTTFSTEENGKSFQLTSHLAVKTTTVLDAVPCSGCTSGAGSCKDSAGVCAAPGTDKSCAANTTACTASSTAYENQLKFSFIVSGWEFAQPSNTLIYGLVIESKGPKSSTEPKSENKTTVKGKNKRARLALDSGFFDLPTTATIKGGAEDKEVDIEVTTTIDKDRVYVDFKFPSFASGESLYYDPDVAVDTGDDASSAGALSACVWIVALLSLASAAVTF